MVAIVTGNGLGLTGSSAGVLGAGGQIGSAATGLGPDGAYVNAQTGNLVISRQDELLIGLGPDIGIVRTYNSNGTIDFDNNDNWQISLYRRVFGLTGGLGVANSTIKRTAADGAELTYTYDATRSTATDKVYISKDGGGSYDSLTFNTTTNLWAWQDGDSRIKETYELQAAGATAAEGTHRINTMADTDGNKLNYSYDIRAGLTDLISEITTQNGEKTQLVYNTSRLLTQINVYTKDQSGVLQAIPVIRTTYSYDTANRLNKVTTDLTPTDVTDSKTYLTTYTYDGTSKRITSLTNSDGTKTSFTYETSGLFRVLTVKDGLNNTTTFAYPASPGNTRTITDAQSQVTTLTYSTAADSSNGLLTRVQGPTGSGQDINYAYDINGNVTQMTDSRGNVTKYTYDANGNQTRQEDATGNTITRTYSATNQLLSETVYATPDTLPGDATYNAALPQTTRYAYDNEEHLRFIVSPAGRVTEYRYDANGTRTAAIQYTANLFSGTADESTLGNWVTTTVTDKTKSQRTDYGYDVRGQLATRTAYTSIDSSGAGVVDTTTATTQYVYDQSGNLIQTIDARGVATTGIATDFITAYTYDGLNRLISQTDALGNVTTTIYNSTTASAIDGGTTITANSVAVRLANGLVTINAYDLAGRLISVKNTNATNTALGTTSYLYDTLGQLRQSTDSTGQKTYYLYDSLGRQVGIIDPEKALTETIYNNNNQVVRTIQYTNAVTATLSDATALTITMATTGIRPNATPIATDRVNRNFYDKAGRLAKQVDALNFVTEYQYDGASRLVKTTQYNSAGTVGTATGLNGEFLPENVTVTADTTKDRLTRQLYNDDGLLQATLDAEGYLTEYIYDATGQRIRTIRYATIAPLAQWATGTLAALRPALDANDQTTHFIYNARGQLEGTVDPLGYLTEYQYDVSGNRILTKRYATTITYTIGATAVSSRPASNAEDQSTTNTFDDNNRIKTTTSNPDGLITEYSYDSVGNLTQKINTYAGAANADKRSQFKQYDLLGRVTRELSGEGVLLSPNPAQVDAVWDNSGTRYTYDLAGRIIIAITPNGTPAGNKTLYYYDTEGKLRYEVNAVGEVTEYIYSRFDQRTTTRQYKTRIVAATLTNMQNAAATSTTGVVNATTNTPANTALTALNTGATSYAETLTAYNNAGQAITFTDALLNANSRTYNAFGELDTRTDKIDATTSLVTSYLYDSRGMVKTTTEDAANLNRITQAIYDAFGRITQTTDGRGVVVNRAYDRLGREVVVTDALNTETQTTYDAFSRVLTRRDGRGVAGNYNTVSYAYDTANRRMTMTTSEGISVVTTKNRYGETIEVKDGRTNITTYTYNADGQLKTTTTATGTVATPTTSTTTTSYDAAGKVLSSVDARGTQTTFAYDAVNRVLSKTVDSGGLNLKTEYRYDALGRQTWVKDAKSVWIRTDYDNKGQVTSIAVDPLNIPATADANGLFSGATANAAGLNITTNFTYDARGKRLTVTEGFGSSLPKTTQYVYDKLGRLASTIVDPGAGKLNITTSYTYDKNDNVVLKTDANLNKTVYTYDADNRLSYTVDALGNTTKNDYDVDGNLLTTTAYAVALLPATLTTLQDNVVTNAQTNTAVTITPAIDVSDQVNRYVYDKDSRRTFSIDSFGYVTKYEYDANGNVLKTTKYSNAMVGTPATGVAPAIVASAAEAATLGRTDYVITNSAIDQVTQSTYDAANRVNQSTNALGIITSYSYDANGNQLSIKEAVGTVSERTTYQEFDKASRKTAAIDALGNRTETTYDATGNIVTVKDALGNIGYFYYDAANRMTLQVNPEKAVTETKYDALGNQTDIIRYANKISGTLSASTKPVIGGSTGTYVTLNANADQLQKVSYDAAGRKLNIKTAFANTGGQTLDTSNAYTESFTYDAFSNVLSSTARNGAITSYTYDKLNRKLTETLPITARDINDATNIAVKNSFSYDAFGNLNQKIEADGAKVSRTTNYTYDLNNQQLSESVNVYLNATQTSIASTTTRTYDANGNVSVEIDANGNYISYQYDSLNRLTLKASGEVVTVWSYDAVGNKVNQTIYANKIPMVIPDSANDRVTYYTYDAVGRELTSEIRNMVVGTVNTATNTYNPITVANLTKQTVYDANGNIIKTIDPNGNITRAYYNLAGEKVAEVDAAGYLTTWARDAYGNVSTETKYAKRLSEAATPLTVTDSTTLAQITATAATLGTIQTASVTGDRITSYSYDRLNRVLTESRGSVAQGSMAAWNTTVSTTVTLTGSTLTKTGGTNNTWGDAEAYSNNALTGAAYVSARAGQITLNGMFGLNADPATNKSYSSLDYAWYVTSGGALSIYESNVNVGAFGTYMTSDVLAIEYKGNTINYLKNGTVIRSVTTTAGRTFSFDSSFYSAGFTLNDIQFSTPPSTTYVYDGLNNVTQKTDAANATTNWVYDKIGRQTNQSGPVFTDNTGNTARIRTDKEYDGLNNLNRIINRGATDSVDGATLSGQVETDDEITTYTYSTGGRLISETDATGAVTQYTYDKKGNALTKIFKNRRTADQILTGQTTGVDDISTYTYDSLNRQLSSSTKSTAEATYTFNEVQYNSFGEVINKRTYANTTGVTGAGAVGWDEFAEYDQAGRVFKTNSEDGVVKVMAYDKNGNVTIKVTSSDAANTISAAQNTQAGLTTLLAMANTQRTMSVYDVRNQLLTTIQAAMDINHQVGAISTTTGTNTLVSSINPLTTNVDAALNLNPINAGDLSVGGGSVNWSKGESTFIGDYNYQTTISVTIPESLNVTGDSLLIRVYITSTGYNGTIVAYGTKYATAGSTVGITINLNNCINHGKGNTSAPTIVSTRVIVSDNSLGTYVDKKVAAGSGSSSVPKKLYLKGQPTGTNRVLLSYRPAGTTNIATTVAMSPVLNTTSQAIDGFYSFDYSALPIGVYEFSYAAMNAAGDIVNQQSGTFNTALANSPATVTLNPAKDVTFNPTNTVTINGNSLIKTSGASVWTDASVFSQNSFIGSAYLSAKAGQNNKNVMIGLNSDPMKDKNYSSLDYAWYANDDGNLYIYESGVRIGSSYGTYTPNDVLAVQYLGTAVNYLKNGVVIKTTTTAADRTFYMDSSFFQVGATLNDVKFGVSAATATDLILNNDNSLVKTGGSSAAYDAEAVSKNSVTDSAYVSARAGQTNLYGSFGLNSDPLADTNYTSLDYSWYANNNGVLYIYENGVNAGTFGTYTPADVLAVEYIGTNINYLKNGVVLRTVATTAGRTFYMDSSFYSAGFTLNDVKFGTSSVTATDIVLNDDNPLTNIATTGWGNSDSYSLNSSIDSAYISARAGQSNLHGMFGLNSDPLTDKNYTSLDYAWYAKNDGTLEIYESNVNVTNPATNTKSFGTYTSADILAVEYVGTTVNYLKNGVVIRSVATTAGRTLYMDSSFYNKGFTLNDVKFGATAATAVAVNVNTVTVTETPTSSQTGIPIGGLGHVFISDAGSTGLAVFGLQLVNQGSTADNVTLKYRVKNSGSAWSTIAPASFVKSATNSGYGLGHFSLATSAMSVFANATSYEVEIEVRDSNNNLLRITSTEISRDAAGVLNPNVELSLKKLRLGGQSTNSSYVDIAYRPVGSTGAYSSTVRIYPTAANSGLFDWDITGIPAGNQDVSIKSYDASNVLLNNYQSYITFGNNSAVVNAISALNNPRYITINPPNANSIDYVVAGYRLKNTAVDYTPLPMSMTVMNGANKEFRISIPILNSGDYEYIYTAFATDIANYVDPASITITPPPNTPVGTANIQAKYALKVVVPANPSVGYVPPAPSWTTVTTTIGISANGVTQYKLNLPANLAEDEYLFEYQTYTLDTDPASANYNTYQWSAPVQETFNSTILTNALVSNIGEFSVLASSTGISNTQSQWTWTSPTNTLATIARQQSYNAFGEVATETDGRGNVSQYTYNTLGMLTRKQDPTVSITLDNGFKQNTTPITTYTYDNIGRMVATMDANGNLNRQTWLAGGSGEQTVSEWHADGGLKTRKFDVFGNKVSETDEVDRTTLYAYDKDNQLIQVTHPSGAVDKYTYDEAGQRIAHTNALNDVEKTFYDSLGRITQTKTNMGFATSYSYTYTTNVLGLGGAAVSGWVNATTDAVGRTRTDTTDMFNHTVKHQDLGNNIFTYNYNSEGWLTSQTGTTGQNIVYSHYNNGYIKSIQDKALGMYTFYEYDADGNKAFEGYVSLKNANDVSAGYKDYFQQATITYDALNRITRVEDPRALITYEYDAVGNRRMVRSEYKDGINGANQVQEYWYKYDKMNRFVITMGQLPTLSGVTQRGTSATDITKQITQGPAGSDGVSISYNMAGERVQASNAKNASNTESYTYNLDGYLTDITVNGTLRSRRTNDILGRTTKLTEYFSNGTKIRYSQATTYDKDNRTLTQKDDSGNKTWFHYFTNSVDRAYSATGAGELAHTFSDSDGNGNRNDGTIIDTSYDYEYWDEAKMTAITADPYNSAVKKNNRLWANGYSDIRYDVNGHISGAVDRKGNRNFSYVNDAQGVVLLRSEVTGTIARPNYRYYDNTYNAGSVTNKVERFYYVDGKAVGAVGNDGPSRVDYVQSMVNRGSQKGNYAGWKPVASADFDQNYEPISPTNPGGVAGTYTVRNGDTLQSIARTVWGDSAMWYLIADANGLTGSGALTANQVLTIPNKVTNIHNNAGTFRPYNPGEAIGDLNPTLPAMPKPPKKKSCGGIGVIIMAVVAVVATIYTAGLAAGASGAFGSTMAAGAGAMGMTAGVAANVGAAIIGGMVGSIASQAVGMALGVQEKFNWSAVASSAIGAGLGASSSLGSVIGRVPGGTFGQAIAGNLMNQGVGMITGSQKGFSWTSVAAAAIAAPITSKLANSIKGSEFGGAGIAGDTLRGALTGAATSTINELTRIAFEGGKVNWASVAIGGIQGGVYAYAVGLNDQAGGIKFNQAQREKLSGQWDDQTYDVAINEKNLLGQGGLSATNGKTNNNGLRVTYFDNGLTSEDDLSAIQAGGLRVSSYGVPDDLPPSQGSRFKGNTVENVKNQARRVNQENGENNGQFDLPYLDYIGSGEADKLTSNMYSYEDESNSRKTYLKGDTDNYKNIKNGQYSKSAWSKDSIVDSYKNPVREKKPWDGIDVNYTFYDVGERATDNYIGIRTFDAGAGKAVLTLNKTGAEIGLSANREAGVEYFNGQNSVLGAQLKGNVNSAVNASIDTKLGLKIKNGSPKVNVYFDAGAGALAVAVQTELAYPISVGPLTITPKLTPELNALGISGNAGFGYKSYETRSGGSLYLGAGVTPVLVGAKVKLSLDWELK